jgi:hypothetical protein
LERRSGWYYGIDLAANTCYRAVERFPALHAIVCDIRELHYPKLRLGWWFHSPPWTISGLP